MSNASASQDGYELLTIEQLARHAYDRINAARITHGGLGAQSQRQAAQSEGAAGFLLEASSAASAEVVRQLDGMHELIGKIVKAYALEVAYRNSPNAGEKLKWQLAEIVRALDGFASS